MRRLLRAETSATAVCRAWLVFTLLLARNSPAANPPVGATILIAPGSADAQRFSGVARMGTGCTAFLIKPPGSGTEAPSYVVTAGHCVDLGANSVIVNRADTSRTFQFQLFKGGQPPLQVRSRRVLYSTMKGIDVAILELDSTLAALESSGQRPLLLARSIPAPSSAVEWAGVPYGTVPGDERFVRTGHCAVSGFADVLEWRWLWRGAIRHDCSDISTGASGSPLLDAATGLVLGVIGTTNVGNLEPGPDGLCERNDPCELQGARSIWRRNSSYATPVAALAGCFNASGLFDLTASGCGLDPGIGATVLEARLTAKPGELWNATVASDHLKFFRYKVFAQGAGDCADDAGYGQPLPVPGRVSEPLAGIEGRYFLCIVAGISPSSDPTWQSPRFAAVMHLRADATPPDEPLRFTLSQTSRGVVFIPGTSFSTGILVKPDNSESSTCSNVVSYPRFYPVPYFVARENARRLCMVLQDSAGNFGVPAEIDLMNPSILPGGVFSSPGYQRGRAAPGSWISIFGVNLITENSPPETTRVFLLIGGAERELEVGYASLSQINARLPEVTSSGAAEIIVAVPGRPRASAPLRIQPAVPGIFTVDSRANSFGVIFGLRPEGTWRLAMDCSNQGCSPVPLEGVREFAVYVGGLGTRRQVTASLAEQPVEILGVNQTELPGVDEVRLRLPDSLRLRGYLPMRIAADGSESGPAYVWLR